MIVLDKKKLCFVCIPKNGTHTIYKTIGECGGRRIGEYHEDNPKKVPRSFGLFRSTIVMTWRDPVERAVSFYKDIVIREQMNQRVVKSPISILRHERITALCPTFPQFVRFLAFAGDYCNDYLFRNQNWWHQQFKPHIIVPVDKLSDFLETTTGVRPQVQHTTSILGHEVTVSDDDREIIMKEWAPKDAEILKSKRLYT